MKIAVVTDSGSALDEKKAHEEGIYFLPLQVIIDQKEYLDGVDISTDEVYEALRQGALPSTSMPTMGCINNLFQQLKDDGYDAIIAIPLTSGLSSTSSVLVSVANDIGIDLHLIDCYTTCDVQYYLAQQAVELVNEGLEIDEIINRLNKAAQTSLSFLVPDDLNHLKRGGRLTPLAAALGGLLKIKPILLLSKATAGKIDALEKVRTQPKAVSRIIELALQDIEEDDILCILNCECVALADKIEAELRAKCPNNVIRQAKIGAVISAHTGLGSICIQRVKRV